jgi:hypothetical protein
MKWTWGGVREEMQLQNNQQVNNVGRQLIGLLIRLSALSALHSCAKNLLVKPAATPIPEGHCKFTLISPSDRRNYQNNVGNYTHVTGLTKEMGSDSTRTNTHV